MSCQEPEPAGGLLLRKCLVPDQCFARANAGSSQAMPQKVPSASIPPSTLERLSIVAIAAQGMLCRAGTTTATHWASFEVACTSAMQRASTHWHCAGA